MAVFQYFSYGSNLLRERIRISNPTAKFRCVGKLSGYTLKFGYPAIYKEDRWKGAAATIEPETGSRVMGCVWEIDAEHTDRLDKQEKGYDALTVDVELTTGETVPCRTYIMKPERGDVTLPSPYYLKVMLDGARQNNMPADYIAFLEGLPTNGATEPPPLYLTVMEQVEKFRKENPEEGGQPNS